MQSTKYTKKYREESVMNKNEYSNKYKNMGVDDMEHFGTGEQHRGEAKQEGRFFQFLYNLKEENPWEERDFNSVFKYL
jgi:hypothetical protein